jgi:hypothetical protein
MNVETGSIGTKTSRSSGHSAGRSSKESKDEGKEGRRRRRRGPTGANVVAPDLPFFLQQQRRIHENQTPRPSMDHSTSSSIPTLDSEETDQKWQIMEQMEILSMEEAAFEKQIEEARRKLSDSMAVVNDTKCNQDSYDFDEDSSDNTGCYIVPKTGFFIPGITGRASCLAHEREEEKDKSFLLDGSTKQTELPVFFIPGINGQARCLKENGKEENDDNTVQTELPAFFIPGITGQARCLKEPRSKSSKRVELAQNSDSGSSKKLSIDRAQRESLTRSVDSIREALASRSSPSAFMVRLRSSSSNEKVNTRWL